MWFVRKTNNLIISIFGYGVYYELKHWKDRVLYKDKDHILLIRGGDLEILAGKNEELMVLGVLTSGHSFRYKPAELTLTIDDGSVLRQNGGMSVMGVKTGEAVIFVESLLDGRLDASVNVRVLKVHKRHVL